jgi:hypothetical protein
VIEEILGFSLFDTRRVMIKGAKRETFLEGDTCRKIIAPPWSDATGEGAPQSACESGTEWALSRLRFFRRLPYLALSFFIVESRYENPLTETKPAVTEIFPE